MAGSRVVPQVVIHREQPVPQLRHELVFRPQAFGGQSFVVVEDPLSGRFFRLGLREYTVISLLDGCATLHDVVNATRQVFPNSPVTLHDAAEICQWALSVGLVHDPAAPAGPNWPGRARRGTRRSGGWFTPFSVQLPLLHPDRLLTRLQPWFGWCFSVWGALVWCAVVLWALRDLVVHGPRLLDTSTGILAVDNWFWLGVAWLILKMLHEGGHAIACKRLGGEVREAGVIFILLAPLAYVDVTSTWRWPSKWARMAVAAAGMYVELFVAAVATLVWSRTAPGVLNHVCFNVMATASIMTLLFNANPLMRFDGYYILSDLFELPNLYAQGQRFVSRLLQRVFLGIRTRSSLDHSPRGLFVRCYGIVSLVWRYFVLIGLGFTAATLLDGAGIVLSMAAVAIWCSAGVRRVLRLAHSPAMQPRAWGRLAATLSGGLVAVVLVGRLVPWPGAVVAPAVVCYAQEAIVRTDSAGFVAEIHVESGQWVRAGDVLAILANPDLEYELASLEVALAESQLKRRVHVGHGESAKAQVEKETLRTLENRLEEKREQVARLVVRAPCSGNVIGRNLQWKCGTYLPQGSELVTIGREDSKEIRISIAQQDLDTFGRCLGEPVRIGLPGRGDLQAPLTLIEPRASKRLWDAALCARHGGPLPVRPRSDSGRDVGDPQYELLTPRFTGIVSLPPAQSLQLCAGQRAKVSVADGASLGGHLHRVIADWVDARLHAPRCEVAL